MKVQISSWNDGTETWNAEVEETAAIDFDVIHEMDKPAQVRVIIADPDGTKAQKYNSDVNDNYLGPSKITIEHPDATDLFYGRIVMAEADLATHTVTLYCQDWLGQLSDRQIDYEMREDLDGSGLREAPITPDYDLGAGNIRPAWNPGTCRVYFKGQTWALDQWNGAAGQHYLVMSDKMAGNITVKTGPYTYSTTGTTDTFTNDIGDLWTEDTDKHITSAFAAFNTIYNFRVWTPASSTWYQSTRNGTGKVTITYSGSTSTGTLNLYNGATYDTLGLVPNTGTVITKVSYNVPDNLLAGCFDANGEARVKYDETAAGGGGITIYFIEIEFGFVTTGYSSAITITDTVVASPYVVTSTDLSVDATRCWHGLPCSIAKPIYLHFESATGPVLGYDDVVTLTCGVANVENTSGVSTRSYINKTPLYIAQDLARQDKAHFWITLGGSTVTYKSTFNDGAPAAVTDATFINLTMRQDYGKMFNKVTYNGMRVGDRQLTASYTDATSADVFQMTKTQAFSDTGIVSEYDCLARATAAVNQQKDIQKMLFGTIAGLSSYRLGTELSITSAHMGLTAAKYIIQRWKYRFKDNVTEINLHPRVSQTGLVALEGGQDMEMMQNVRRGSTDLYVAPPPEL